MLGKHLGVGVTSIYWYFRKKNDLLNAMTDRALREFAVATPYVDAADWRRTLGNHARDMRKSFLSNPILSDLVLIRSALSPRAAQLGVQGGRTGRGEPGPGRATAEQAFDAYSAVSLHVRGSVVLQRLYEKNRAANNGPGDFEETMVYDAEVARCWRR